MEITSPANSKIKEMKKEKAKNHFLLFLDTPNLVKEAILNNFEVVNILVEKGKNFDFLDALSANEKQKIIVVGDKILKEFSKVEQNSGIIGVFKTKKNQITHQTNILVLDRVQDPGNVGTLLRSALGSDFKKVFLIDCAHISNEKVIRSSAGAIFKLDIEETSFEQFEKIFKTQYKDYQLYYADMHGKNIFEAKPYPEKLAVVMGNEGKGVSDKIKQMANGAYSLPMKNGLESLNVAVSGSLIMYLISFGG